MTIDIKKTLTSCNRRLPRNHTIVELDFGGVNEFGFEYVKGGLRIAAIRCAKKKLAGKVRYVVMGVNVLEEHRRKGIGTILYELAAAESCRRRVPLASDERVGDMSAAFWAKQIAKGRAEVLSKRGGYEKGAPGAIYSLRCPPPCDLSEAL